MTKIYGAVFPLPHDAVERLLSNEKDVFAKYGRFLRLSKGNRIVFYDSSIRATVGEAKISEIAFMNPTELHEKYGARLFLTTEEFRKYKSETPLGSRENREKMMTVCVLESPKRYPKPQKLDKKMNMIGHYLSE